jgi:hypothetical protein
LQFNTVIPETYKSGNVYFSYEFPNGLFGTAVLS